MLVWLASGVFIISGSRDISRSLIYIYIYSETYLRLIGGPSGAKFEPEALKDPLGLLRAPARAPKS